MGAIDIEIRWGTSLLHLARLAPRSVYVGESGPSCDCVIPAELLGATRAPLVIVDSDGSIWLAVLPGATGTVDVAGQPEASLRAPLEEGRARPYPALRGAHLVPLPPGARAVVELGGLVFHVGHDVGAPPKTRRPLLDEGPSFPLAASLAAHAFILIASALAMPPLPETPVDDVSTTLLPNLGVLVGTLAERELEEPAPEPPEPGDRDDAERALSKCGEDNGGSMGEPRTGNTGRRYGVNGPADNPDPHLARPATWLRAETYPYLGWVQGSWGGDPHANTMPWGRDDSLGNDARSAHGNMWGDEIGDAFGSPGIGIGRKELCASCGGHGWGTRTGHAAVGEWTPTERGSDIDARAPAAALALR